MTMIIKKSSEMERSDCMGKQFVFGSNNFYYAKQLSSNDYRTNNVFLHIFYLSFMLRDEMSKESEISGKEALEQACRGMDIIYFM